VPELIKVLPPDRDLVADRSYDARAIIDLIAATGGRAHISTCKDRKIQRCVKPELYRQRTLIERFFCNSNTSDATRYDKTARNFLAAIMLAATRLWIRQL
jgi:transposase